MTPVAASAENRHTNSASTSAGEVWAVTSYRAGETGQILALAKALADAAGLPWRRVEIDYQPWAGALGLVRSVTATGAARPPQGPSPSLLISAGLRNEPICRWIAARSGGQTRVIFLGRTWATPAHFDLVVTTPQYRLKSHSHVLENPLTLHAVNHRRLEQARSQFAELLANQQRQIGVLLGGNSGPYRFDRRYARRLADGLNRMAREQRARLLISSSSRTPSAFLAELCGLLSGEPIVHDWNSNEPNPYLGILAWSDALVVSADSIAMISEAVAAAKPVLLSEPSVAGSPSSWLYHSAMSWGHRRWTRDVSLVHGRLLELGLVRWLEAPDAADPFNPTQESDPSVLTCLPATVDHILHNVM